MSRRIRSERGTALVEMAFALPLLLLLILAMLDLGLATNYWHDNTQLAGQGARLAAVNNNAGGDLKRYIRCQAETPAQRGPDCEGGATSTRVGQARVCVDFPEGTDVGDPVKVTVHTTFNWLPFVGGKLGASNIDLVGQATMRLELRPTNLTAGCA